MGHYWGRHSLGEALLGEAWEVNKRLLATHSSTRVIRGPGRSHLGTRAQSSGDQGTVIWGQGTVIRVPERSYTGPYIGAVIRGTELRHLGPRARSL